MSCQSDRTPQFVVLKFGGTSVATKSRWQTIGRIAQSACDKNLKPIIVCSALSGVSNILEGLLQKIAIGQGFKRELQEIRTLHEALAVSMSIEADTVLGSDFATLENLLLGCSLIQEVSPRVQAHVMSFGEIFSTRIGGEFLRNEGLKVAWQDARECLTAVDNLRHTENRRFLSGACSYEHDDELCRKFAAIKESIIVTQGFIARNSHGQTVLLGRGGSDTSAAYFAAKLAAARCEIWTDVPGLYTANPREIETARILNLLDYDEAQEMASMGAKVLHPRCIAPVRQSKIPLHIRCTNDPDMPGTVISNSPSSDMPRVKCVSAKNHVTLVSIESLGMWQEVGFLADLFLTFKNHGLSIDLVSTSETNVTVSIDTLSNALQKSSFEALQKELSQYGGVKILTSCATVSLVGRNIRSILHQLGPALKVFEEQRVYLVSQAASDLNLSFVVDEKDAPRLVQELHKLLFDHVGNDPVFGPSWQDSFDTAVAQGNTLNRVWWQERSFELTQLARECSPLYVYDEQSLQKSARSLLSLRSIDRVFYAVKANDNAHIVKTFFDLGLGFECVSVFELDYIFDLFPEIDPDRVLFTPNFAPKGEYEKALQRGCLVTLDNLFPLEQWPKLFEGREILLRLDPGRGIGHHKHVQTAGEQSKFGIARKQIGRAKELVDVCNAKVIGLHAHAGSGIARPSYWVETADFLLSVAAQFESVKILNLGGGLFVPSHMHDEPIDLQQLDHALSGLKESSPNYQFWLEPGRFLVAQAGVLLARVTQLKDKGDVRFIGIDAGMNTLIRPALYGAYHHIVNLSRQNEKVLQTAHVVGPICESGDTLGYDRKLPPTFEGDVMLIANVGAYGRVMSSSYNRRAPCPEHFLRPQT